MSAVLRLEPLACYFLPAGKPEGNPTELLQSAAMPGVIAALSAQFDGIVSDSPPVAPFTDALSLKKEVDGTLLVVRAGQTPSASVEEVVALLGREHLFGIVLNAVEGLDRLYSKYSKYYKR
jgi:Mrp family chromosome partitioning ATPase